MAGLLGGSALRTTGRAARSWLPFVIAVPLLVLLEQKVALNPEYGLEYVFQNINHIGIAIILAVSLNSSSTETGAGLSRPSTRARVSAGLGGSGAAGAARGAALGAGARPVSGVARPGAPGSPNTSVSSHRSSVSSMFGSSRAKRSLGRPPPSIIRASASVTSSARVQIVAP